jgi:hypothetical protein
VMPVAIETLDIFSAFDTMSPRKPFP